MPGKACIIYWVSCVRQNKQLSMRKRIFLFLLCCPFMFSSLARGQDASGPATGQQNRNKAREFYNKGVAAVADKNYALASDMFSTALELDPGNDLACLQRGKTNLANLKQ